MTAPIYPISQEVSPGQPTSCQQYNRLRTDTLRLGAAAADAVSLGTFLGRYMRGVRLAYLAENRLRIAYDASNPPVMMINGYMCVAQSAVDLAAGSFSGDAEQWYLFAVRTPGSTTFTLTANTNPTEAPDQRLIGMVHWNGAALDLYTLRTFSEEIPAPRSAVICLHANILYSTQTTYTAANICHQRMDWGKILAEARSAYLVANLFAGSGTAYARLYDTTNSAVIVELSTIATAATTMVKSADILSLLPAGDAETRFEVRTSASRADCYWAAVEVEY
jgi:hypothetical protein